jgi:tetratricopeptide (TPR) repeat protein
MPLSNLLGEPSRIYTFRQQDLSTGIGMSLQSFPCDREKTIGVCMIVKNEAHVVTRCLDSVRPLIDYVLVEDTGSADGTQSVIQGWMRRNDVPGLVIEEPWRDFAYNRSHALDALRKVEAVDYALIIDADDQLVLEADFNPTEFKKGMRHDLYQIQIQQGDTFDTLRWRLPRLCSNTLPFYFRGVLHERLEPLPWDTSHLPRADGFYVRSGREGGRNKNPHKYRDDAATLEKALLTETDSFLVSRYTFYLAQSYRDCGEREKALTNYLKRAQQGFWTEETFYSLYQAGMLQESLGFPPEEVLATYARASDASPSRAEALHATARYCRSRGNYEEGYQYAKRVAAATMPEVGMFTVSWIYDYGLLEELACNAFCVGRYEECLEACQRLLRKGKITPNIRDGVKKVADFAAGIIAGFYLLPYRERAPRHDPNKYRKDSQVLTQALRAEDDAFLRARYTFYLALSLQNAGEGEKALATSEDAVRLHRELKDDNADGLLPDLASTLDNLSKRLSDFGRREEALAASEEAVGLYREFAGRNGDALYPELASALNNLSKRLSDFGRSEEALNAGAEATKLYREAAGRNAGAFLPELASALNNLSKRLSDFGRREEALAAKEEAVKLYREVAALKTDDASTQELALALDDLSHQLFEFDRREQALAARNEARRIGARAARGTIPPQKAIFVCGPWGAGTSLATKVLMRLGCVGKPPYFETNDPRTENSFESKEFRELLISILDEGNLSFRMTDPSQILESVALFHDRIVLYTDEFDIGREKTFVFKQPLNAFIISQLNAIFDARFLFVLRPITDIDATNKRRGWRPVYGRAGALQIYDQMFKSIADNPITPVILQYKSILQSPLDEIRRLAKCLNIESTDSDIRAAAAAIRPPFLQ